MLTRRELLLSAGALGLPMAAALPLPVAANGDTRFGALQSRAPFIDERDLRGTRQRALDAYRVLLRRSLEQHGPLDWLAGGAFPLSGPGPFSAATRERLALTSHSAEVEWLASFAGYHRLRLTLGAWWREPGAGVAPRLLVFESDGQCRSLSPRPVRALDRMQLQMPKIRGAPRAGLAALCSRRRSCGVRIETPIGPLSPPGARTTACEGSVIIGPDGNALARAGRQAETCLVAEV